MATWAEWDAAVVQARVGVGAAELHGSLTGYLCAGWGGQAPELLAALALEAAAGSDRQLHTLLDTAARDLHAQLVRGERTEPLLPPGPLAVRANAMVDWCRGLLGGLGLTGVLQASHRDHDVDGLLADFGRIASMHLTTAADDAAVLDEVLDFIRAGVVQLHAAFAPQEQA